MRFAMTAASLCSIFHLAYSSFTNTLVSAGTGIGGCAFLCHITVVNSVRLDTDVECVPQMANEIFLGFSGAMPQCSSI